MVSAGTFSRASLSLRAPCTVRKCLLDPEMGTVVASPSHPLRRRGCGGRKLNAPTGTPRTRLCFGCFNWLVLDLFHHWRSPFLFSSEPEWLYKRVPSALPSHTPATPHTCHGHGFAVFFLAARTFAHRASNAFFAISRRRSGESFDARAFPPSDGPLLIFPYFTKIFLM